MAQSTPDSFYLHFDTEFCDKSNRWEFIVQLSDYIHCGTEYEIGLVNCSYANEKEVRYFCTNLIDPQNLHTNKIRILKVIPPTTKNYRNLFTPTYVQMSGQSSTFNSFSIYILNSDLNTVNVRANLIGTLHIKRKAHHD